jgi:hypothetical protein
MKSTSEFLKFENLNFSNNLKWRNIQNKVVVHEKLWKFVVRNFFLFQIILPMKNYIWISQIWNSNFVNNLEWRNSKKWKL